MSKVLSKKIRILRYDTSFYVSYRNMQYQISILKGFHSNPLGTICPKKLQFSKYKAAKMCTFFVHPLFLFLIFPFKGKPDIFDMIVYQGYIASTIPNELTYEGIQSMINQHMTLLICD